MFHVSAKHVLHSYMIFYTHKIEYKNSRLTCILYQEGVVHVPWMEHGLITLSAPNPIPRAVLRKVTPNLTVKYMYTTPLLDPNPIYIILKSNRHFVL